MSEPVVSGIVSISDKVPSRKPRTVKRSAKSISASAEKNMKDAFKKYSKIVLLAKERGLNESDTSNIINDLLGELWGYDKFFDVTTEYRIKGQFADYGVKIDDRLAFLIEVKSIGLALNENHIFQAASYASTIGCSWVVLTNLEEWRVYHLSFGSKIENELVLAFSLADNSKRTLEKMECLHKEAFRKGFLEQLWANKVAMSRQNLQKVLLSEPFVKKVQRELVRITKAKI